MAATPSDVKAPVLVTVPRRWAGATVMIIAGGPSLAQQLGDVWWAHERHWPTIAINDAWRAAPFATMLYACDAAWWRHYAGVPLFGGEKWTQDKCDGMSAAREFGLTVVRSEAQSGLSTDPDVIHQGLNSGFQALNIAMLSCAARIILLGFDMQATSGQSHWHGDHPPPLQKGSPYSLFMKAFADAAPQLAAAGVDVINCSRETALTCFLRARFAAVAS